MATTTDHGVAKVDYLIDENASPIEVEDNSTLKVARDAEPTVGATGPTNWWRIGLLVLAVIVVGLFLMQMFGGGPPVTETAPQTPVTTPLNQPVASP